MLNSIKSAFEIQNKFISDSTLNSYKNHAHRILFQYDNAEILYSVAYFFKKHNSVKCNYEIYDKKLIIIVHIFEK